MNLHILMVLDIPFVYENMQIKLKCNNIHKGVSVSCTLVSRYRIQFFLMHRNKKMMNVSGLYGYVMHGLLKTTKLIENRQDAESLLDLALNSNLSHCLLNK